MACKIEDGFVQPMDDNSELPDLVESTVPYPVDLLSIMQKLVRAERVLTIQSGCMGYTATLATKGGLISAEVQFPSTAHPIVVALIQLEQKLVELK